MTKTTSWEKVSDWYKQSVSEKGNYYHQKVVIPKSLTLLNLNTNSRVLDLACGQGVFSRSLPDVSWYSGVDISASLVADANKQNKFSTHEFLVGDITKPLPVKRTDYTHTVVLLALQNVGDCAKVLANAKKHLVEGGKLLIVINHPCFRIPRYSEWDSDYKNNVQYRRVEKYMSELEIKILTNPGLGEKSEYTLSFHRPLSFYIDILGQNDFKVEKLSEWLSDKESVGKHADMENVARLEFPLFMGILAVNTQKKPRLII